MGSLLWTLTSAAQLAMLAKDGDRFFIKRQINLFLIRMTDGGFEMCVTPDVLVRETHPNTFKISSK